jgi:hypothetical protein
VGLFLWRACNQLGGRAGANVEAAGTGTISSRITGNIVRVGLNYQFH